uniref:(northern house mosquito) hypothetical protein n=1 Tax=Culex pipiens TaxID=7175 RepID=A0A8D8HA16_CULPI
MPSRTHSSNANTDNSRTMASASRNTPSRTFPVDGSFPLSTIRMSELMTMYTRPQMLRKITNIRYTMMYSIFSLLMPITSIIANAKQNSAKIDLSARTVLFSYSLPNDPRQMMASVMDMMMFRAAYT